MRERTANRLLTVAWLGGAVLTVIAWSTTIWFRGGGFPIRQGDAVFPDGFGARSLWIFGGLLAWALATKGLVTWASAPDRAARFAGWWNARADGWWIAAGSGVALALALAVRFGVLHDVDVLAHEAAYRFQAHLLLGGHPYAISPRYKLFFDTDPMVNDGRWYPPHGPGWPLLLAPFLAGGVPWLAAPVLFAATVPGLFLVVRRWAGSPWARLAVALLALSPMAVISAGTELSGTAALCTATWSLWALERARDEAAPAWAHALLGAGIGLGLAIHPWMAAGWGLPLGVAWLIHARRERLRAGPVLAFALPVLAATGGVLALQVMRTGSLWTTGWDRVVQYAAENHYRLTAITKDAKAPSALHRAPRRALVLGMIGGFRVALDAWGLPAMFLPAFGARKQRGATLLLAMALGILFAGGFGPDAGPDLFGPTRFHVLLLPAICAIALGAGALTRALDGTWRLVPAAGIGAVLLVCTPTWSWVDVTNLDMVVDHVRLPVDLTKNLDNAVVFVPFGQYAPWCSKQRVRNPDRGIPVNLPSLDAPVLWVDHVNLYDDKQFLARAFPNRNGWFLSWDRSECLARLRPLSAVSASEAAGGLPHSRASIPSDAPPWRR